MKKIFTILFVLISLTGLCQNIHYGIPSYNPKDSLVVSNKRLVDSSVFNKIQSPIPVFDQTFFTSNTGFTFTSLSPSYVNGAMRLSGGAGTFGQFFTINGFTSDEENVDYSVTFTPSASITATSFGFSIGKKSVNPFLGASISADIDFSQVSISGTALKIGDGLGLVGADSISWIQMGVLPSVGDILKLTYSQRGSVITFIYEDITTATKSTAVIQANFLTAGLKNFYIPNTSDFALWNHGGQFDILDIKIVSNSTHNPKMLIIGDSKTSLASSANDLRWPERIKKLGSTAIFAGVGDRTVEVVQALNYIKTFNPRYVIMNIGRNDLSSGVATGTWQANYKAIHDTLQAHGAIIVHLLPIPEPTQNQAALKTYITTTFPSDPMVDPSTSWDEAHYMAADSVHENMNGHRFIADLISSSGTIPNRGDLGISSVNPNIPSPYVAAGTGITGSGVSPQVAIFSGPSTLTSSSNFTYTGNVLSLTNNQNALSVPLVVRNNNASSAAEIEYGLENDVGTGSAHGFKMFLGSSTFSGFNNVGGIINNEGPMAFFANGVNEVMRLNGTNKELMINETSTVNTANLEVSGPISSVFDGSHTTTLTTNSTGNLVIVPTNDAVVIGDGTKSFPIGFVNYPLSAGIGGFLGKGGTTNTFGLIFRSAGTFGGTNANVNGSSMEFYDYQTNISRGGLNVSGTWYWGPTNSNYMLSVPQPGGTQGVKLLSTTAPQLTIAYDGSDTANLSVGSTGYLTIAPSGAGGSTFFTGGVNPTTTNSYGIGNSSLVWTAVFANTFIPNRRGVADVNASISSSDYLIAYTTLTGARTVTLPAASSVTGEYFIIKDETGNATSAKSISLVGTVDGVVNPVIITSGYGISEVYSNGTSYFFEKPYAATSTPLASTYTPALTNGTNVASSTSGVCSYQRIGNIVTITGRISVTPTSSTSATLISISLPFASTLSLSTDALGVVVSQGSVGPATSGFVQRNGSLVQLGFNPNGGGAGNVDFVVTYVID